MVHYMVRFKMSYFPHPLCVQEHECDHVKVVRLFLIIPNKNINKILIRAPSDGDSVRPEVALV